MAVNMGVWRFDDIETAIGRLERAGLSRMDAETALMELGDQLVVDSYYVPTQDELLRDYGRLGAAHLRGRINVRWLMCRETYDALRDRYNQTRYVVAPDIGAWRVDAPVETRVADVRMIMQAARRWDDPGQLFGIPIRIDPVARTPVFEMIN